MKVKKILSTAFLSVLTLFLVSSSPVQAATVYQLSDNQPADYPTTIGDYKFAELVAQRTGGRIKIDVYHSAQLFDEKSAIETAQMGGLAFCRVSSLPMSDFSKSLGVLSLPYIFRDEDQLWKVLNGPIGEEILKDMSSSGLVGLTYYDSGSRNFYNSKHEVKTPADMKGLKIRVQQSKLTMDLVQSLGASATPMAYGEVYTALQSGVIDGAENNWPSYYSTSQYEVAHYYTLDEHTRTPEVLCMSKVLWDKLSPEDQKIVKQAAVESQATQRKAWKAYEAKSIKAIKDCGFVTVTKVEDFAAWQKAVMPIYKTLDLGPKRDEYIKRIKEVK